MGFSGCRPSSHNMGGSYDNPAFWGSSKSSSSEPDKEKKAEEGKKADKPEKKGDNKLYTEA